MKDLKDKKLAEEILKKCNGETLLTSDFKFLPFYNKEETINAMEAYHQAKLNEVTDEDIKTEAGLRFENVLKPTITKHKFEAFVIGAKAFRDGKIKKR